MIDGTFIVSSKDLVSEHNYSSMPQENSCPNVEVDGSVNNVKSKGTWQFVSGSKRSANTTSSQTVKKSRQQSSTFVVRTTNSFDVLRESDEMEESQNEQPTTAAEPKPPPIFVPDVMDIKSMLSTIETAISKDDYNYKCLNQNKVKICPLSIDAYRKLVHKLTSIEVSFHTYQLKQDKPYRVVIKNMHSSTDPIDIKNAIADLGFNVRNVVNVLNYKNKNPLPMFFVDLEPQANNKEIFKVQYILNAKIVIEPPRKKSEIIQCKKCQSYGHTKSYCWHPYRCVKCGQNHDTRSCTKPQSVPPRCALCDGNHPANYKGCTVYKDIKNKSFPTARQRTPGNFSNTNANNQAESHSSVKPDRQTSVKHMSYAQVVASPTSGNDNSKEHGTLDQTINRFLDKFEKLMLQQAQQIGTLMNLLTTVINKLK